MNDKELVWSCALRYALGRKTYIVKVVCDWFMNHKLSKKLIEQSLIDIDHHEKYNILGQHCDRVKWLELKMFLKEKLNEISKCNSKDC